MSLGESLLRGAAGGAASFIVGKMLAPYLWEAGKTGITAGTEVAKSALKATGIALAAFTLVGTGCGVAYWAYNKTSPSGGAFDMEIDGWNGQTIVQLHRWAPGATIITSIALASLTVRFLT